MIAVLTDSVGMALGTLDREGNLQSFNRATLKGKFKSGREFLIVGWEEQLAGETINGYRIIGSPSVELVKLAQDMSR
jgi:hypothetical protein